MMDDIAEQQEVAREISDAISNPVAFGDDVDEVSFFSPLYLFFFLYLIDFLCVFTCHLSICNSDDSRSQKKYMHFRVD